MTFIHNDFLKKQLRTMCQIKCAKAIIIIFNQLCIFWILWLYILGKPIKCHFILPNAIFKIKKLNIEIAREAYMIVL